MASSPYNEVAVFLDMNTCPIIGNDGENLVENINVGLRQLQERHPHLPRYRVADGRRHKFAFGDITNEAVARCVSALIAQDFEFLNSKERYYYCTTRQECIDGTPRKPIEPTRDFGMEAYMLRYAVQTASVPPWNILAVSSDFEFSTTMRTLSENGYTVFLAKGNGSNPRFGNQTATYTWNWEALHSGMGGLL